MIRSFDDAARSAPRVSCFGARGAARVVSIAALAGAIVIVTAAIAGCADSLAVPDPDLNRMLVQPRADPFAASAAFADGKVLQTPPAGTVPYRPPNEVEGPPRPTRALLELGRARYDVACAVCHGVRGDGDTIVASHMELVKPRDLHIERLRRAPVETFFDVATRGFGLMPPLTEVLTEKERWAVAYYVKALQRSQRGAP